MWNKNDQKGQDRRMTTQTSWRVGLWTLLIAVTALGGVASAQSRQAYGSRITVLRGHQLRRSERNVRRRHAEHGIGRLERQHLEHPGAQRGDLGSRVDANYGNQCQAVTGNIADLRTTGWNDRISSLRRINIGGGRGRGWDGPKQRRRRDGARGSRISAAEVRPFAAIRRTW